MVGPDAAAVLIVLGADDDSIPTPVVALEHALAAAEVPHEMRVFDAVGHAFITAAEAIARDPV